MAEPLPRTVPTVTKSDLVNMAECLNGDLKIWYAHTYHLVSAGKPPDVKPVWKIPFDQWNEADKEFIIGWENWLKKVKNSSMEQLEPLQQELGIWFHGAQEKGVNLSSIQVGAEEPKKDGKFNWKKIALYGGGAFAIWYFFLRESNQKPTIIDPMPSDIKIPRRVDVAQESFLLDTDD